MSARRNIAGSGLWQPASSETTTHLASPSSPCALIVACCIGVPFVTMPQGMPAAFNSCNSTSTVGSRGRTARDRFEVPCHHFLVLSRDALPLREHAVDQSIAPGVAVVIEYCELVRGVRGRSGGSHGGVCLVEQSSSRKDRGRTVPERVVEVEKGGGVFGWHKPHSSLARAATRLITDKHFKMCTFDQKSRSQTQAPAPVRPSRTRCLARDGRE